MNKITCFLVLAVVIAQIYATPADTSDTAAGAATVAKKDASDNSGLPADLNPAKMLQQFGQMGEKLVSQGEDAMKGIMKLIPGASDDSAKKSN